MTSKAFISILLLFLLLTACVSEDPAKNHDTDAIPKNEATPIITSVETNYPEKEGWIVIPTDSTELNVTVEATNSENTSFLGCSNRDSDLGRTRTNWL
ncbi:hypothetical protein [Paenibacillus xylanivorans]|uniref:Uncharacterized protein n=1 Tax=Paenibacillus xylanivorans TaxID=1705561 RepID=A0A0M9BQ06_9BACL|nr:hypothetical protein [Paenibacillus xylanivorans]KOY16810.1 hypothetical protein AMS66_07975 [Paenibacillus xylanivorans]